MGMPVRDDDGRRQERSPVAEWSRAVVLIEPRTVELRTFPTPGIGPDEGLLQIEACGICGTDYEQYLGDVPKQPYYTPYPVVLGHEPLGIIAAIGARASERWGVRVGDRVAVRTGYGCGRCEACRRFQAHRCPSRGGTYGFTDVGTPPFLWGGYADYMYLSPYSAVCKVRPDIPAQIAVMFNPLAAGLSWARSVPQTRPGEQVVILGPGQRGLCAVVAAREAGAGKIVVTGLTRDRHKLALARELGADIVIDAEREDVVEAVREATGGGADVIVDTTPLATEPVAQAIAVAARRARIVLAGLKGRRATRDVFADDIIYKELRILGTLSTLYDDFVAAIGLIESGKYPLEKLHTHSFALEEAEEALQTLAGLRPDQSAIQVAIVPSRRPGPAAPNLKSRG